MRSHSRSKAICAALLCVSLVTPLIVEAAGSSYISGHAYTTGITFYTTQRTVTNPSSPGPEVAFNQSWGMAGLFLGTHDCKQGGAGPIYAQDPGVWNPVAYYTSPATFCILTYSNLGSGGFGGTLAWD